MSRWPGLETEVALHHVIVQGMEAREISLAKKDHEDLVNRLTEIAPKTGPALGKGPTLLKDLGGEQD